MELVLTYKHQTGVSEKTGKPTYTTIKHYWCVCDVCGVGTYIKNSTPLTKTGKPCRMTPRCGGKHRKPDIA